MVLFALGTKCSHGFPRPWMATIAGNFGQGDQDEEPLLQPRMGEDHIAGWEYEVVVQEKIEIEGSVLIAIVAMRIPEAPQSTFDGVQQMQETAIRQRRQDQSRRIGKPLIAGHVDRLGGIEGRKGQRQNIGVTAQLLPRQREQRGRVTEVGSQADGGLVERTVEGLFPAAAIFRRSHVNATRS